MNEDFTHLKETNNRIAVRHGLPPIGAMLVNKYGIKWLVDGHLYVPTLSTIARCGIDSDYTEDPQDLYPVIIPQNLSPLLADFIAETDRCTSKVIMPVDTMPSLRPGSAHPESYSVDGQTSPYRIVLFLDAAQVHETILAHEIGHIWIDLVEDCEDYRMLKNLSNPAMVFQWTTIQSFVLDNKVNEVIRERGFDMSIIERHQEEALASLSLAIISGYRPPNPREAVFLATTLAADMLDQETGVAGTLQSFEVASMVFQRDLPDVYELACQFAASVRRHGYSNRTGIRRAINECASLSFRYIGESLDLDNDLEEETPTECCEDKRPTFFPGLPVAAKLEIGKAMARMKAPIGAEYRLSYSPGGSVQIQFSLEPGIWTSPTLLHHAHRLPHDNSFAGRQHSMQKGNPTMNKPTTSHVPTAQPAMPTFPPISGRRTYAPGLAVFLSRVRLQEQLMGEHPYGYAMNNPMTNIDPSGLMPCPNSGDDPCAKYPPEKGFWDKPALGSAINAALAGCPDYDRSQLTAILFCIVENESRDKPGTPELPNGYKFPTTGSGVQGPCQIWPGPDKDAICGTKWRNSLQDHMNCCAKLLCHCLKNGGGNLVTGCGTVGNGRNRSGTWQVINQSGSGYDPRFKCCLIRRGIQNPSQNIPKATKHTT